MIQVGVTGLRDLTGFDMSRLKNSIGIELNELKKGHDKAIMLNSIAAGADQLCAIIGLSLGFELICPLPFPEYRNDFRGNDIKLFDSLIRKASKTLVVSNRSDKDTAYLVAGKYIVRDCDILLAVWDKRPQTSICGTAAVVAYANSLGKEIIIVS